MNTNKTRLDKIMEKIHIKNSNNRDIESVDYIEEELTNTNCEGDVNMSNTSTITVGTEELYTAESIENALVLKVTKGGLAKIITLSILVGILLGVMISTIFFSYKMLDMKDTQIEQNIQAYNTIKEQKDMLAKTTSLNNNLKVELTSSIEEVTTLTEELEKFRHREELYDEYEYILIDSSNNRTDLTYGELEFGINEMVKRELNPHLLFGLIHLESRGNREATNSKSTARGYGQFLKGTGKWVYEGLLSRGSYNHDMAFDGYVNIEMAAEYLSYLMKSNNGDVMKSLISYNGGELGERYYHIINNTLKNNTDTNLEKIEKEYKSRIS